MEQLKGNDVKDLIENLMAENWRIRRGAAEALRMLGDLMAVASLIQAQQDNNSNVRKEVAWALGEIGDTIAI